MLQKNRSTTALVALLSALGMIAYWPALHGFFLSDDFVHVQYMQRMDEDIYVLLKNFWSNWLDVPTTLFYRPLVSVSLYLDHLVWGWNPGGYHLTNMLMHATNGILVFLIMQRLAPDQSRPVLFPFFGAALFLLSPLHPEAVYWIIGRVDVQVTLFYLLSTYLFLQHAAARHSGVWLLGALLSFVGALMTKEPAVTLPAVLAAYSFFFLVSAEKPLWHRATSALKATAPFWITLALYFIWRRHVLGTFGGGYTGGGTDYLSFDYWKRWDALIYLILPINQALPEHTGIRHTVPWLFLAGWGLLAYASYKSISRTDSAGLRFGLTAFVLSLLPLVPVFNVSSDLQSSRFLYLPAAFLWVALGSGLSAGNGMSRTAARRTGIVAVVLLTGLSAYQLHHNLQPWRQASKEIRIFSKELDRIAAERERSAKGGLLVLAGIPDNIHGAQFLRNGYGGFLGAVFHPSPINDLLPLTDHDRTGVMPIHAKTMAETNSAWLYGVYRYFPSAGIQQVASDRPKSAEAGDGTCRDKLGEVSESSDVRKSDGAWEVTGPDPLVVLQADNCHADAIDALRVSLAYTPAANSRAGDDAALQVYWRTENKPFSEERSISLPLHSDTRSHEYVFPLRSSASWDVGHTLQGIRLDFPAAIGGRVSLQQANFIRSGAHKELPQFSGTRLEASDLSHVSKFGFDPAEGILALELLKKDEFLLLPRESWDPLHGDTISLRMRVSGAKRPEGRGKIYWATDKSQNFSEDKAAKFSVKADGRWHSYSIPLKHLPTWWTNGEGRQLRINPYYGRAKVEISSISVEPAQPLPRLALLDKTGEQSSDNPNGTVFRRTSRQQAETVQLAYHTVEGYAGSILQVRAQPFPDPNIPDQPDALEFTRKLPGDEGTITIDASQFKGPGMRYLRIVSVDAAGKPSPFASDPVAVLVVD